MVYEVDRLIEFLVDPTWWPRSAQPKVIFLGHEKKSRAEVAPNKALCVPAGSGWDFLSTTITDQKLAH